MKTLMGMMAILSVLSLTLMGCPPVPQTPLTVMATLQNDVGQELFADEVFDFDQLMIPANEGPVYGNLRYTGESLKKLRVSFYVDGEIISLDVFNEGKTFEDDDLWGYLITIGVVHTLQDFEFSAGTDESGVAFNALDFYLSEIVDKIIVTATTSNGTAFTTTLVREDAVIEDNYLLLTESSPVEGGTVTGAGTYPAGTEVTITATSASGWTFDHWTVNGTEDDNNPGIVTMNSDVTVVAVFTENITPTNYTLSITTEGQGTTTGAGSYEMGTVVTITATPDNSGWTFDHWVVNGTTASNNPGTITMNSDVTVVAVFTENITPTNYILSMTTQGQGTATGAGSYEMGTEVTITATPASGWTFDHWVINGTTASNNPRTITMDSDKAIVAVFITDANPGGLIKVNLTWSGNTLSLAASDANPGSIGLELYHQSGGSPWIERQVFTVTSGNASGTVSKFRPNILRFGIVSDATSGGYIPLETMTVKINGQSVPLVDAAFQVDVSTL